MSSSRPVLSGVLVVALLLPAIVHAQSNGSFDIKTIDPETFQAIAMRVPDGRAPKIDGRLTEEIWSAAPAAGNFVQREPRFG